MAPELSRDNIIRYTQSNGKKRYDSINIVQSGLNETKTDTEVNDSTANPLNDFAECFDENMNNIGYVSSRGNIKGNISLVLNRDANKKQSMIRYKLAYNPILYSYQYANTNFVNTYDYYRYFQFQQLNGSEYTYFYFNKKANYVSYTCQVVIKHPNISSDAADVLNYIRITANDNGGALNGGLIKDSNYTYIPFTFNIDMNSLTTDQINGNKPVYTIDVAFSGTYINPHNISNWVNNIYDIYPIIAPSSHFAADNPDTKYENNPMFVGNYGPKIIYNNYWADNHAGKNRYNLINIDNPDDEIDYIGIDISNIANKNSPLGTFEIDFYDNFIKYNLVQKSSFYYTAYIKNRFIGSNLSFLYNVTILNHT